MTMRDIQTHHYLT